MNLIKIGAAALAGVALAAGAVFLVQKKTPASPVKQPALQTQSVQSEQAKPIRVQAEPEGFGEKLMAASSDKEVRSIAKKSGAEADTTYGESFIAGVPYLGENFDFAFYADADGTILRVESYSILYPAVEEEDGTLRSPDCTPAELMQRSRALVQALAEQFGCDAQDNFYLIGETNLLENTNAENYQQIIDGTASLEFRILDGEGNYWLMKTESTYRKDIVCWLTRYAPADGYEGAPANFDFTPDP